MERPRIISRALLIAGLSVTGAFGNVAKSEAAPPDTDKCHVIQTRINEVIVVCSYPSRPERTVEKVKQKCLVTKEVTYPHRSSIIAKLSTALQKNCWGPSIEDYSRKLLKNPPKTLPRLRP